MKKKVLAACTCCLILVAFGAVCSVPHEQKISAVPQGQVPPKVFDSKISRDGKKRVQIAGSMISVMTDQTTLHSFVAPSLCENDIDKNVWFGEDDKTILYYTYCGSSDGSMIYRLSADTGEVIKQYPSHAVQLDVHDTTGRVAAFARTQKESGLLILNLRNAETHILLQKETPSNGVGMDLFVENAYFSPSGYKLFFAYSERSSEIESTTTSDGRSFIQTSPFKEYRSIYDISADKTINVTKSFSFQDGEAFYGWVDDEMFATKDSSGKYRIQKIDQ